MLNYNLVKRSFETLEKKGIIQLLRSGYEYTCSFSRQLKYKREWKNSAPRANELIKINPQEITHLQVPFFMNYLPDKRGLYILDGSWDTNLLNKKVITRTSNQYNHQPQIAPFENYVFFTSVKNHFENGISWEETDIWDHIVNQNNWCDKRYFHNNNNDESNKKALEQLNKMDSLYKSIKQHGYLTQKELKDQNPSNFSECLQANSLRNEIIVNIGRHGKIIFDEGKHRLCVVKSMDIDHIPVRVFVRHRQWQELRDEVANASSKSELSKNAQSNLNHPDIKKLVNFH